MILVCVVDAAAGGAAGTRGGAAGADACDLHVPARARRQGQPARRGTPETDHYGILTL